MTSKKGKDLKSMFSRKPATKETTVAALALPPAENLTITILFNPEALYFADEFCLQVRKTTGIILRRNELVNALLLAMKARGITPDKIVSKEALLEVLTKPAEKAKG